MLALPSVLVSILNGMLVKFSEVYVAVLGIFLKLQSFIYMPANGIIQGMRPIIGYNYGCRGKGAYVQNNPFKPFNDRCDYGSRNSCGTVFP